eukprot:TRINITY_DN4638_c0_g2_i4.p1 TRINITY_DN4638_c0_g2~~TRINITY_DN4638_c0_g2_i4.p1  ORF type:complete len:478 (+),score=36.32 TRINITY_DN4638_c0_g2_i4:102-1535(+)
MQGYRNYSLHLKKELNIDLTKCRNFNQLLKVLDYNILDIDPVNVSTAAIMCSRILTNMNLSELKNQSESIEDVYVRLCQLMLQHADEMSAWVVANCLWSLGKAAQILGSDRINEYDLKIAFERLSDRATIVADDMIAIGASNILWAMARFEYKNTMQIKKFVQLAVKTTKNEDHFKPQDITNNLWAIATLGFEDVKVTQHFAKQAKKCLEQMTDQGLSNLMYSLQQLRYYDRDIFLRVEEILQSSDKKIDAQSISVIMLAFTDLGLQKKGAVIQNLVRRFESFDQISILDSSRLVYSLAIHESPVKVVQNIVNKMIKQHYIVTDYQSLELIYLRLAQVYYTASKQSLNLIPELENYCVKSLKIHMKEKPKYRSQFLNEVFQKVVNNFSAAQKTILINEGQTNVDIAIFTKKQVGVAVQIRNKQAYFVNKPKLMVGRTKYNATFLQRLGWKVVIVNEGEWKNQNYRQKIVEEIRGQLN